MAKELIKSDRTIQALKPGAGRLSGGAGLYLLPPPKNWRRCSSSAVGPSWLGRGKRPGTGTHGMRH